ncbi:MAG: tetratricopeptide repeat protein, partial [Leptolyngbya sp.]|nr:tetratricopeptide repeat protein [Candidatus Melainabacteria bacterium]
MESDENKNASKSGKSNIGTLIGGARELAVKVRPYQEKIKKAKKIVWAVAIVWATVIAVQSLPYYGAIGKGESYFKQGHYPEAEKEFLYCYEQCKNVDEKDPRLARVLNNLGMLYRGTGRYKEAE